MSITVCKLAKLTDKRNPRDHYNPEGCMSIEMTDVRKGTTPAGVEYWIVWSSIAIDMSPRWGEISTDFHQLRRSGIFVADDLVMAILRGGALISISLLFFNN
jgi:hypothetical protein